MELLKKDTLQKEDVSKKIMPNRCALCDIGIGTSMLYYENTWRPFEHLERTAHFYYWEKGRVKLCSECFEFIKKHKDAEKFLGQEL